MKFQKSLAVALVVLAGAAARKLLADGLPRKKFSAGSDSSIALCGEDDLKLPYLQNECNTLVTCYDFTGGLYKNENCSDERESCANWKEIDVANEREGCLLSHMCGKKLNWGVDNPVEVKCDAGVKPYISPEEKALFAAKKAENEK